VVGGLNFTFAPPSKLVTSFFIIGAFFYFISGLVFWGIDFLNIYYLDPKAVGFMHLFLLGFMMSVIFGAMYQLISVVLEIPIYSTDLAYAHLGFFVVGIIPFLSSFLNASLFQYLGYGSIILYISFLLYIINILLSIKAIEKLNLKAYFIASMHIVLFIGVTYGLLASLGIVHGELGFDVINLAHSHIALVLFGFGGGLISIIATVLLPMFLLSHNFNKKITTYLFIGLLIISACAIFEWKIAMQLIMIATILAFSYQLYDIFTKRMRRHMDVYAYDMITSGVSLIVLAVLIPFLSSELAKQLFMIFLILGFISSFLVGHIYKIVPFLVWNEKFAPLVGKQSVPMLADMVHKRGSEIEFGIKLATIAILTLGVLIGNNTIITIGKILFLTNTILVVANVIYIFMYKGKGK
jgi:hypothetical protein